MIGNIAAGLIGFSPKAKNYQAVVLADNPTGFWMFNETSGSTGTDLTANGNNMTFRNSPTLNVSTGLSGITKAITFNGTNQVADTAIVATFNTAPSANWSCEVWFKTTSTTSFASAGTWKGAGDTEVCAFYLNATASGKVAVRVMDAAGTGFITIENSTGTYNDNNWHYACATSTSGGAVVLYIDGVNKASSSAGRFATSANRDITAAANSQGETSFANYLAGSLAARAVYSTTLSSTQVTAHYNEGI